MKKRLLGAEALNMYMFWFANFCDLIDAMRSEHPYEVVMKYLDIMENRLLGAEALNICILLLDNCCKLIEALRSKHFYKCVWKFTETIKDKDCWGRKH